MLMSVVGKTEEAVSGAGWSVFIVMAMFGGGMKRGYVYGKTADERPCTTIEKPMPVEHLHATIYHAPGIPPDLAYVAEKRPVYVTSDGKGVAAIEIFG